MAFNHNAEKWWSELHRAAKTQADRATGFKGKLATRVWEKRKRGLAHLHGVVSVECVRTFAVSRGVRHGLRELALRYGFGFVDGWHRVGRKFWPAVQAAAYLSSYFAGGRGGMAITENCLPGRLVVFVGRNLSKVTGCTMRNLRNARRLWAAREGLISQPVLSYEIWLGAAGMLQKRLRGSRAA